MPVNFLSVPNIVTDQILADDNLFSEVCVKSVKVISYCTALSVTLCCTTIKVVKFGPNLIFS